MKPLKPFDYTALAELPGRIMEPAVTDRHGAVRSGSITLYNPDHSPYAHSICVQPHENKRKPFTVGIVRIRAERGKATLELCDRLSEPLIEIDAVMHEARPDVVCDLGYGITPGTVIEEGTIPDYIVLWPGKPTTSTIATFVEDYTWFEAFSEEGCATGIACTPAPHLREEHDRRRNRP